MKQLSNTEQRKLTDKSKNLLDIFFELFNGALQALKLEPVLDPVIPHAPHLLHLPVVSHRVAEHRAHLADWSKFQAQLLAQDARHKNVVQVQLLK